jgi:energy-coupling factor transporter transmembrane protein EcfT
LITIFIPLYVGNTIAFQIHIGITINIYKEGIYRAFLLFLRVIGSVFIFLSFFSSLTYSEFIDALTTLRLPSIFVGSLIIMLHYIPILARSHKKILDAQELRGKKVTNYRNKLKAHAFIMGKSIVSNMERSEKLFESLKMRGFTGKINFARKKVKILDLLILTFFTSGMICFSLLIDLESIYIGVLELFLL